MIAKVSGLNPAGIAKNPNMASTDTKTKYQKADGLNNSSTKDYRKKEQRPELALSLKMLIGAFCVAMAYCIFTGLHSTFAAAK